MAIDGKQVKNASIPKSKLNLTSASAANDPIIKSDFDAFQATNTSNIAAINTSIASVANGFSVKTPCIAATTGNITLTGTQTIDGVVLNIGDRVLVKNQTTASANGIYIVATGAWTRATDADTSAKLVSGSYVNVNQGTANMDTGFVLTTDGAITLGTTALVFDVLNLLKMPVPVKGNLGMTALKTVSDFDPACASTISKTPAPNSAVSIEINGIEATLGDGVKTAECFFSSDLGVTAKTIANIISGDKLYWVGSVAGFQLEVTDKVSFAYVAV